MSDKSADRIVGFMIGTLIAWAAIALIAVPFAVYPYYRVWEQNQEGHAELARAQSNRQIKVAEAEATYEASKRLAEAEVERAKGVAEANKIIGDSLKGNDSYLRYLWIDKLTEASNDVIYVPTEAGIPILEAGRRAVLEQ